MRRRDGWGSGVLGLLTSRFGRYSLVSVGTVGGNQLLLAILAACWHTSAALLVAVTSLAITGPSYVAHRTWVWKKKGPSHVRKEVLPYIAMVALGAVWSTALVALVARCTKGWSGASHAVVLDATYLGAYFVLWVGRYFVLGRWIFHRGGTSPAAEISEAPGRTPVLRVRRSPSGGEWA